MIEDRGLDVSETITENADTEFGSDAILLAQANTGSDAAGTIQSDVSPSSASPGISVIVPDAENRVTLAASASIENIQLDGNDLLLIQPDGSQIRIIDGALNVPTFIIGEIEIPQEVLVAALDSNGFNVAAGPGNTLSVSPQTPTGAGGEFEDSSGASIAGDGLQTLGLLADTSLADGSLEGGALLDEGNVVSELTGGDVIGSLVESEDNPGGVDADPVAATGTITFFDPDFGETRTAEVSARTVVSQDIRDIDGRVSLTDAQLDALLAGFNLDTPGGITVESTSAAGGSIDWTYFVDNDAVDFLADGEVITLSFEVQINDGILTATQTVTITVTGTNDAPFISNEPSSTVQEDDLANGTSPAAALLTATGDFGIDWGADFGDDLDTADVDGVQDAPGGLGDRSLTFGAIADQPTQPTASDGVDVQYVLSAGDTVLTAYKGDGRTEADKVFEVSLSDDGTGSYNFVLLGNVDHADPNGEALELNFAVTATDAGGDTDTGTFSVTIGDDVLIQGTAGTAVVLGEDGLGDANASGGSFDASDVATTGAVSLGISWGADDDTQDTGSGDSFGRSVGFSNAAGTVASAGPVEAADAGLTITGGTLTSGGVALVYVVSTTETGGQVLTATKGADGEEIFTLTLDATATNGAYTFELLGELDHDATSDSLTIGFSYAGTDADGDQAANGTASVTIEDDTPVAGDAETGLVDEDGFPVLDGVLPNIGGTGDVDAGTVATGSLDISWGADDGNRNVDGGFNGTQVNGDRSVVFDPSISAPVGLTSNNVQIVYTLNPEGTVLTATAGVGGAVVFTVALSDAANGSYTFTLEGVLDHPDATTEDTIDLDFGFVARDGDGDAVSDTFQVGVNDDSPVALGTLLTRIVEEEELADGNEDTSGSGDLDFRFFGNFINLTTATAGGSLNVLWGADNGNSDENGGFDGSQVNGDRSVSFTDITDAAANVVVTDGADNPLDLSLLTSNGESVEFRLIDGNTTLEAYTSAGTVFVVELSDTGLGSYTFVLGGALDHPAADGENALRFTFSFTARDGDGDGATNDFRVQVIDDTPVAGDAETGLVDEDGFPVLDGVLPNIGGTGDVDAGTVATGSLDISWGADDGNRNVDGGFNGTQVNGDRSVVFDPSISAPVGLTSNNVQIVYTLNPEGTVLTATAGVGGAVVFTVALSDAANGSYTFTLEGVLDHPDATTEDTIDLDFGFVARDGDGDAVSDTFQVGVNDDSPVALGTLLTRIVEEEELADGNEDTSGSGDLDFRFFGNFINLTTATAGGSLNVLWGADNGNSDENGGFDGSQVNGDRSVSFTDITDAAANVVVTDGADNPLDLSLLTSNGESVEFRLIDGNTTLEAYTSAGTVFVVELSDTGLGSYTFVLGGALDHPAADGENALRFTFSFTARDGDGDGATNDFRVQVIDDTPVAGDAETGLVDEDGFPVLDGVLPNIGGTGDVDAGTVATGSLDISWGADDGNRNVDGGFNGTQVNGDRSVVFDPSISAPVGLTSNNVQIVYTLNPEGTVLTATAGVGGAVVFTVALSDAANGSYTFTLEGVLDHPDATTEDTIDLDFGFVARDGDGDAVSDTFQVGVNDDSPVALGTLLTRIVEEEELADGNEDTSGSGDLDFRFFGNFINLTTATAGGSLNVLWGADNGNSDENGGFDGSQVNGDRSVSFTDITDAAANVVVTDGADNPLDLSLLTSNGESVEFRLIDGNTTLEAYTSAGTVFVVELSDTGLGSYTFVLGGALDHPAADGENALRFTFSFTARDGDGDGATNDFRVQVIDDTPVAGDAETGLVDEDGFPVLDGVLPNIGGTGDVDAGTVATGSLDISWGADDGNRNVDGGFNGTQVNGDRSVVFDPSISAPVGLTSNNVQIVYTLNPEGTVLTATAGVGGAVVFTVALSDAANGSYTFTLEGVLDHPDATTEDTIDLDFGFVARDGDGDAVSDTFQVGVNDDSPVALGTLLTRIVEEEELADGNEDTSGSGDLDFRFFGNFINLTTATAGGSLNVLWGADNGNSDENGGFDGSQVNGDRSVSFTDITDAAANVVVTDGADNPLDLSLLTSNGESVEFRLIDGNTTLEAYTSAGTVFVVELSDTGLGSYTFVLGGALDHPAADGENALRFTFSFTARDGDGDGATNDFRVQVIDDTPVAGDAETGLVDEDGFPVLDGVLPNIGGTGDVDAGTVATGSLDISWGADDGNRNVDGGFNGTQVNGDRSVVFDPSISAPVGLTSNNVQIVYTLNPEGTVLTATAGVGGAVVFTVALSDAANGSYTFTLEGVLDHPDATTEDTIDLDFGFVARDGDGDAVSDTFQVGVNDDSPVALGTLLTRIVEEEELADGNEDTSGSGDLDFRFFGNFINLTTATAGGSLNVLWGADNGNSDENGGFDGSQVNGDRSVSFTDITDAAANVVVTDGADNPLDLSLLTSNGESVEFRLIDGNTTLEAYTSAGTVFVVELSDTGLGSYTFVLGGALDHPAADGENALRFTFSFTARDGDGDGATNDFRVQVIDDTPVAGDAETGLVDEDGFPVLDGVLPNIGGTGDVDAGTVATGSLDISWGADDGNRNVDGGFNGTQVNGDRSVVFDPSISAPVGLTSNNVQIVYTLNPEGTVLTATAGVGGAVVFTVALSDAANGSYTFTLEGVLDHPDATTEDTIDLDFGFVARDGDGDAVSDTFQVGVNDDSPVALGTLLTRIVEEEELADGNEDTSGSGDLDFRFFGNFINLTTATAGGSLNVLWGADNGNSDENGGFDGSQVNGDRSVSFTDITDAAANVVVTDGADNPLDLSLLTSNGESVEFRLIDGNTTLEAYTSAGTVFVVELSDTGLGSYTFVLGGALDHPAADGENALRFTFSFTARDGDGDGATNDFRVQVIDDTPVAGDAETGLVDEDGFPVLDGVLPNIGGTGDVDAGTVATGSLDISWGADDGNRNVDGGFNGTQVNGDRSVVFDPSISAPVGLTSNNVQIVYTLNPEGTVLTATAGVGGAVVFTVALSDAANGSYTFTLEGVLDHPDATTEDTIDLDFGFVARDGDGDAVSDTFQVGVNDDSPVALGTLLTRIVEEEELADGNEDTSGSGDLDFRFFGNFINLTTATAGGSLNVLWGADNGNSDENGGFDGSQVNGDRSVSFTDITDAAANVVVTDGADNPLDLSLLTSNGESVEFRLIDGNTTLEAYTSAGTVFVVELSDTGLGSYTFVLGGALDHPAADGENALRFTFSFTARDGDGDGATNDFRVQVIDDTPVAGDAETGLVDEDGFPVLDGVLPNIGGTGDVDAGTVATGSLDISWGADDGNRNVDGGFNGTQVNGDRSVVFDPSISAPVGLTSNNVQIVYTLNPEGTVLTATAGVGGAVVFTVALSDAANGSYTFTLEGVLDHPDATTEDTIDLDFGFVARDGDGDAVSDTFQVGVNDDSPVALGTLLTRIVEEEELADGNEDTSGSGDLDFRFFGNFINLTTATAGGSLNVLWGADNGNSDENGGFDGSQVNGDRSVSFTDITDAAANVVVTDGADNPLDLSLLTSNGESVEFRLIDGNTTLEAYTSAGTVFVVELSDTGLGSYTFVLGGALDHPAADGENALRFTFSFTARDGDGDGATNDFRVQVIDDTPVAGDAETGLVDEDGFPVLDGVLPNIGGTGDVDAGTVATGSLDISWGADDGNRNVDGGFNGTQVNGDRSVVFDPSISAPVGLTSNNVQIVYTLNPEGTVLTATAGVGGAVVFTVALSDAANGSYTFTLEGVLDHPDATTEDTIDLDFGFVARDGDGDAVSDTFQVGVNDDSPVALGTLLTRIVEEEELADGNEDTSGSGDLDFRFFGNFINLTTATAGGSLNVLWGADNGNSDENGGFDGSQVNGDRSVSFTDITDAAANVVVTDGADNPLDLSLLTSNGESVEFRLIDGNTTLEAYTSAGTVFVVELSDTGLGSYTFVLGGALDHPAADGENALRFTFSFTARDGDGDGATNDFRVQVIDDTPVAGDAETGLVDEDGFPVLDGVLPNIGGTGDVDAGTVATGSLDISWGADDGNRNVDGGFNGTQVNGDRSVVFDPSISAPVGLTSNNVQIVYTLNPEGTVLTATAGVGGAVVFTVALSDAANGSYTFTLEGVLDHPDATTEDTIDLDFGFVARDGDGDAVSDTFQVGVNDDSPVALGTLLTRIVEEEELADGNEDTSGSGDLDFRFFGNFINLTTATAGGSLNVLWGADNGNSDENGGFDGSQVNGDRSVSFTDITDAAANVVVTDGADNPLDLSLLTSNGESVEFRLIDGNTTLEAYTSAGTVFVVELSDTGLGSYTFVLGGALDHPAADGENALRFTFSFTARDGDGDGATNDFRVQVIDDTPVAGDAETGLVDEDGFPVLDGVLPNIGGTGDVDAGTVATGSLDISWGADDGNRNVDGGFNGTQVNGDRSVVFDPSISAPVGLTSNNVQIVYTLNPEGTVLTATAGVGGAVVFTVALSDAANGSYTFTLEGVLDHPDATTEDTIDLDFGFVARDGDGDAVSDTFQVGVNDDSPVVTWTASERTNNFRIISDDDTVGDPDIGNPGGVGDSGEYNQTNKTLPISFGADANGAEVVWNLATMKVLGGVAGSGSGFGEVTFAVAADPSDADLSILSILQDQGGAAPVVVAEVTLNTKTGSYNYVQVANLLHADGQDENNATFELGFTAIDGDGDTADDTIPLNIDDDSPVVTWTASERTNNFRIISDDDTVGDPDIGNPGGVGDSGEYNQTNKTLPISFGADANGAEVVWNLATMKVLGGVAGSGSGFGEVTFAVAADPSDADLSILSILQDQGGAAPVVVAEVTLNTKTGSYNYVQVANLLHADGQDENNATFELGFTAIDGDGDTADDTIPLNIDDDSPVVTWTASERTNNFRIISDDDMVGDPDIGNPGGVGDSGEYNQTNKTLPISFGADANGAEVVWNLATMKVLGGVAGSGSGFGEVTFAVAADPSDADLSILSILQDQGGAAPVVVAEVTLNTKTGSYNYVQVANLLHADGQDENNATFELGFTAIDGDGDTADDTIPLNIDDDTPTGGSGTTAWLNDDTLDGGNPGGVGDHGVANVSNHLKHSFGADGPGGISWTGITVANGGVGDFTTDVSDDGTVLEVFQNGTLVITATIDDPLSGEYTLVHEAPIVHEAGGDENQVTFKFLYEVTDGDGDTADGHIWVNVDDDTPTGAGADTITVTEDDLVSGIPNAEGSLNISFGADGKSATEALAFEDATVAYSGSSAMSGLKSNGSAVETVLVGDVLVGYTGSPAPSEPFNSATPPANAVFFVTLDDGSPAGSYSFTLLQPLDHPAPNASTNAHFIDLSFDVVAKDGDNDTTAPQMVTVRVDAAGTISSIDYSALETGVFVNLDGAAHTVDGQEVSEDTATDRTGQGSVVGIDAVTGINDATGGSEDDVLIGGAEANILRGNGGNDILIAGAGNDRLEGGEGNDELVLNADIADAVRIGDREFELGDGSKRSLSLNGLSGEGDAVIGGAGNDTVTLVAAPEADGFVFDRYNYRGTLQGVENFDGTDGNDLIMLPENYTTDGGRVTINGGAGDDSLSGTNSADTINGGEDNDLISGLGGDDQLDGGSGDDEIWGGAGADTVVGGADNDILIGGADNDTLYGNGTDLGVSSNVLAQTGENDIAAFDGAVGDYNVTREADGSWRVEDIGAGHTDALYGIEGIDFGNDGGVDLDLLANVFVFDGSGNLIGTYGKIQDAIDAGSTLDGYTVEVHAGTYAENLSVTKALSFVGVGAVSVDVAAGAAVSVTAASGDVSFNNIDLNGAGTGSNGITLAPAAAIGTLTFDNGAISGFVNGVSATGAVTLGHLEVLNSSLTGNSHHGVFVNGKSEGIGKVTVDGSSFTNNGDGTSNGDGDIVLFEYRGDATIQNVTINNTTGDADTAIQIAGFEQVDYDVNSPIGDVVVDNVEVNGAFDKVAVYIHGYNNLSGLSLTDVTGTVAAGWGYGTYINPTIGNPDGTPENVAGYPGAFNIVGADGSVDLSDVTLVNTTAVSVPSGHALYPFNGMILSAIVNGTTVADTIIGTNGADLIAGGKGDDTIEGGRGADILSGGADNDTVSYENSGGGVDVDLTRATAQIGGDAAGDLLTDFENIIGSSKDDTLTGDGSANRIDGLGGKDTIDGGAGNDVLNGGSQSDTILGGEGDDTIEVSGQDAVFDIRIDGGAGTDTILNVDGGDLYLRNVNNDTDGDGDLDGDDAYASSGTIVGGIEKIDADGGTLFGTDGDNLFNLEGVELTNLRDDTIDTRKGNDTVIGSDQSALTYKLGNGDDSFTGRGNQADTVNAGRGDDTIEGGRGADSLFGDAGNDTVSYESSGSGVDVDLTRATAQIGGDAAGDLLTDFENIIGSSKDDTLTGDGSANRIDGLGGKDTIDGGAGNDVLNGGSQSDTILGGEGDDTIEVSGQDAVFDIRIDGGAGTDTILNVDGGDLYLRNVNNDTDGDGDLDGDDAYASSGTIVGGIEKIDADGGTLFGTDGDNLFNLEGVELTNIRDDIIDTRKGNDTVIGSDQSALIYNLGNDADSFTGSGNQVDTVNAGKGDDTIEGGRGADILSGGSGNDTVSYESSGSGVDVDLTRATAQIGGDAAGDLLSSFENIIGSSKNDTLTGNGSANRIDGLDGDDIIDGGSGNDTLNGGAGNDLIFGGSGNDTFIHNVGDGNDRVDGGTETGASNPDYDILRVVGDGTARAFTIGKVSGGDEIDPNANDAAAVDAVDLLVSYDGPGAGSIRADEVERVEIVLTAGDSVVFGDTTGTALAPTTIVVNSDGGDNTYDLRGYAGTSSIVINDTAGGDTDLVQLAGTWSEWTVTETGSGYLLVKDGISITATNIENFLFQGENGGSGATIPLSELVNVAPEADNDDNAGDAVVEAGGVANGDAGDDSATGNVLANDTDANTLGSMSVTAIQPASAPVGTAVNSGAGTTVAGIYGSLTIHADGTYTYALDNDNSATEALAEGQVVQDVFTYTVTDLGGLADIASLEITITGTNDAAVIGGDSTDAVTEDVDVASGNLVAGGTLAISDVDGASEEGFQAGTTTTLSNGNDALGSLSIDANGAWTYSINNSLSQVQNLDDGESFTETFTVESIDGTEHDVSVRVNGRNDLVAVAQTYNIGTAAGSTRGSAYDLTNLNFQKSADPDIGNSESNPSVTISARGTPNQYDYYRIDIAENGTRLVLDIDYGAGSGNSFDSWLELQRPNGSVVARDDDSSTSAGGSGSSSSLDSYIDTTLNAGTYYVEVGRYNRTSGGLFGSGRSYGDEFNNSGTYQLQVSVVAPGGDPIVLDLNGDGVDLSASAAFDIDADGDLDHIGWTGPEDGVLAVDLDGSGAIEDGSELFSEVFNGGSYADSLEALASLDDNGDGVIDANDAAYSQIKVWQDANSDGVTQEGELQSLLEHGIEAINLEAARVSSQVDGNTVFAEGSYTKADGGTGTYVGVSFGAANDDVDNEDQARQAAIAAGLAIILYTASSEEVAAGLKAVAVTGEPQHGEIVITDDFTVIYTPVPGFEGADRVTLETQFLDGSVATRSLDLAVNASSTDVAPAAADSDAGSADGDAAAAASVEPMAVITGQVITGDDGDNVLVGGDGDDFLFGLGGDDILNGGLGYDELTGGAGADTFVFDADALSDAVNNGIQDLIADYDIVEGDVLDLSALLGSETVTDANAADYVRMNGDVLEVDVDGTGTGSGFVAVAEFSTAPATDALKILVDDDVVPSSVII